MKPADLSKLHDFYQLASPSWMPQTLGWHILFALFCLFAIWLIARAIARWLSNRYRREALAQLKTVPPNQFSALLKRTAMAAWPRAQVASLSGEAWLNFLSSSSGIAGFKSAPGNLIEDAAITGRPVTAEAEQQLRQLASEWVKTHHD
jgi:uncharacterized protein DUF4381